MLAHLFLKPALSISTDPNHHFLITLPGYLKSTICNGFPIEDYTIYFGMVLGDMLVTINIYLHQFKRHSTAILQTTYHSWINLYVFDVEIELKESDLNVK